MGWYTTMSERNGFGYTSGFKVMGNGWYNQYPANQKFIPPSSEYQYPYTTNHWGQREREFALTKSDSVIRILVTGDSFAEGMGAPYDSTWPRLMEGLLISKGKRIEVMVGASAGDDLFTSYIAYLNRYRKYKPDIVLASTNSSDITDYYFRGGLERFKSDGTMCFRTRPWWDYAYQYLHFVRAIMAMKQYPFTGIPMHEEDYRKFTTDLQPVFYDLLRKYRDTAQADGAQFVWLSHAGGSEVIYDNPLNRNARNLFYNLSATLEQEGAPCIFIYDEQLAHFKNVPFKQFTYTYDRHFNSTGYAYMAKLAADSILKLNLLP